MKRDVELERDFELFCKAAEQGHAKAQFMVGWMYFIGKGVTNWHQVSVIVDDGVNRH